jgi:hypothetical protein
VKACKPWDDDSGASYPEAAELVDFKDSWVGNRVREWKRGEYRNLVAGPNGDPHDGGGGHRPPPLHTPPRLIFIFTVGSVSRFPVVGRGRPTGDFELKSSSRIESEVVGQSQAKLGWSA